MSGRSAIAASLPATALTPSTDCVDQKQEDASEKASRTTETAAALSVLPLSISPKM